MLTNAARIALALAGIVASSLVSSAHDSWINTGKYRNAVGEWCCGENDCEQPDRVASASTGWIINGSEFVPYDEAVPSPDGKVWICRRPDRTRRCVFGPPPNS